MSTADNDQAERFVVVVNDEDQHALWPEFADVPKGWALKFGPEPKDACLEFVRQNWVDMRPKSLQEASHLH